MTAAFVRSCPTCLSGSRGSHCRHCGGGMGWCGNTCPAPVSDCVGGDCRRLTAGCSNGRPLFDRRGVLHHHVGAS